MEGASGTVFKMEQGIKAKLVAAGATSEAKAVTSQEADLDMQEENWLGYVAGGLFACCIKEMRLFCD
jgi:hypothetical protein